jgi:RNA polymerase sigma-70 factor, ECF subfamily
MNTFAINFGTEVRIVESQPCEMNDAGMSYDAAREPDLVSAAKNGDHRAFGELYRRYGPSLKRRIWQLVRNPEDTEDVLQDTMVGAFTHLPGFRSKCSFRTWITRIAINNSLMLLRKRRSRAESGFGFTTADGKEVATFEVSDSMPNPEQLYATRQVRHKVSQAVKKLPLDLRMIVLRYHQEELKLVDAAKAVGITESAAKSRLFRARKALWRSLNNRKIGKL